MLCTMRLLPSLLLYLIGGVGRILGLFRLCIFTSLLAFALTILRPRHGQLLRARRIVGPLRVLLLIATWVRHIRVRARAEIAVRRKFAAFVKSPLIAQNLCRQARKRSLLVGHEILIGAIAAHIEVGVECSHTCLREIAEALGKGHLAVIVTVVVGAVRLYTVGAVLTLFYF